MSIFWRLPSFHGHRRETYGSMFLHDLIEEEVQDDYHTNNVLVDSSFRRECLGSCKNIVFKLLDTIGEDGLFSTNPQLEGSLVAGVKTGNADECDFSVDILLNDINAISLSQDPFTFYFEDDIDSNTKVISTRIVLQITHRRDFATNTNLTNVLCPFPIGCESFSVLQSVCTLNISFK